MATKNNNGYWTREEIKRQQNRTDKIFERTDKMGKTLVNVETRIQSVEKALDKIEKFMDSAKLEINSLNWKIIVVSLISGGLGGSVAREGVRMLTGV